MSASGGGDRVTSTPEETAGVEQFDRGFEWAPAGRPCHPVAYLIEALPYAVYGVFLVMVIVAGIWGATMFAGPTVDKASSAVEDVNLNPFSGGEGPESGVDPGMATQTPTPSPTPTGTESTTSTETTEATSTPTPTSSETASPSPTTSPTATNLPTPTDGGGDGGTPTATVLGTSTATATPTSTAIPTATATPSPTPEPTPAPEPNFAVRIDSTNSPVGEGDTLQVDATIENTGDGDGGQTITLAVGGSQRDSTTISLGRGESTQTTLTWTTSEGDAGDYSAEVASEDDSTTTSVSVQEGPEITQFDPSADCNLLQTDAQLTVNWDTTNADSVLVQIHDENGTKVDEFTGTSGSETISDEGGCSETYTFTIDASNAVGSASDSAQETA